MKRKGFLLSVISLILIIAAFFAIFAMLKGIDGVFKEESNVMDSDSTDKTSSGNGGSSSGSDSGNNDSSGDGEPVDPEMNYYINPTTNTGYVVDGDTTLFFKVVKGEYRDFTSADGTETLYCDVLSIPSDAFKQYRSYSVTPKISFDMKQWSLVSFEDSLHEEVGREYGIPENGVIYLAYTSILNCNTPQLALEDLNQNVFFNEEYFYYNLKRGFG